jgi:hypothetical protein
MTVTKPARRPVKAREARGEARTVNGSYRARITLAPRQSLAPRPVILTGGRFVQRRHLAQLRRILFLDLRRVHTHGRLRFPLLLHLALHSRGQFLQLNELVTFFLKFHSSRHEPLWPPNPHAREK